eukprot:4421567-Prymnesium_polylepis.1
MPRRLARSPRSHADAHFSTAVRCRKLIDSLLVREYTAEQSPQQLASAKLIVAARDAASSRLPRPRR